MRDASPVTLRPFRPEHLVQLASWLREPHVARWFAYPEANLEWARKPPDGGEHAVIACGDQAVGYLRWQRVDRSTLDALGLHEIPENSVDADILVGVPDGVGHGIGPRALELLVAQLREDPTVALIGLTSEMANTRAHRGFEKAGFRITRQYDAPPLGLCHLLVRDLRVERASPDRGR
jgi:aminoglycoside 6'-N-acetyltransferase